MAGPPDTAVAETTALGPGPCFCVSDNTLSLPCFRKAESMALDEDDHEFEIH
jgi:hypothetical protein